MDFKFALDEKNKRILPSFLRMTNETDKEFFPQEKKRRFGALIPECIVMFIINAFTIFAFARKHHLRKRTTYLIINLTVADLLVGVVMGSLETRLYFDKIEPGCCFSWRKFVILTFSSIFPLASQGNLSLISLERLHATLYPFKHCLIEKWVYFKIIIGSWLMALLLSSGLSFLHLCVPEAVPYALASHCFVTLLILTISYAIINYSMKSNPLPYHSGSVVSDRKLSVTLFIVTVVSVLTILPAAIWNSIIPVVRGQLSHGTEIRIRLTVIVLYLANSIVNPVIYAIRMQEFREAVKQLTCKRAHEPPSVQPIELHAM